MVLNRYSSGSADRDGDNTYPVLGFQRAHVNLVVRRLLEGYVGKDLSAVAADFRWVSDIPEEDQGYFLSSVDEAFGNSIFNTFFTEELLEQLATVDGLVDYILCGLREKASLQSNKNTCRFQ